MQDGQSIRFHGEGDQEPGVETADFVVILEEQKHDVYQRKKMDLYTTVKLDLVESLCGFQRLLKTLDNRWLLIQSAAGKCIDTDIGTVVDVFLSLTGEVVKNNEFRKVEAEGMPRYKNGSERGNLIINFAVVFPENDFIDNEKLLTLKSLLPHSTHKLGAIPTDAEECAMKPFVLEKNSHPNNTRDSHSYFKDMFHDADDENDGQDQHQRVECNNQ